MCKLNKKNEERYGITPVVANLGNLYDKNNSYLIPGYQRPYEWSVEQIKSLWNTIIGYNIEEIKKDEIDDFSDYKLKVEENVIFGTLQINQSDGYYEIIDGQQRLTTFWLLLLLLNNLSNKDRDYSFSPKNQISNKYETLLNDVVINSSNDQKDRYSENYRFIKGLFDRHTKYFDYDELQKKSFVEDLTNKILNHVVFVVVYTKYNGTISKTIELFNSLNTTGLDLGTKDVFKIRYYDFLKKNKVNVDNYFSTINMLFTECTQIPGVDSSYYVSVEDLIDTFRLYSLCKMENVTDLAKKAKSSSQSYFVDNKSSVFSSLMQGINDFDTFKDLCYAIQKVQIFMYDHDNSATSDYILYSAKELLSQSGYWCFRNIFYVFVYSQINKLDNKESIEKETIETALKMTQIVWQACSIARMQDSKIVNAVLKGVVEKIAKRFIDNPTYEENYWKYANEIVNYYVTQHRNEGIFKALKENAYECHLPRLLMSLSFLNDCEINNEKSIKEVKICLFYQSDKNKKYDIEHIGSHEFYDNDGFELNGIKVVDHIGNLIYLSYSINRGLGKQTGKINAEKTISLEEQQKRDFISKVVNQSHNNYLKEIDENIAIKSFLKAIDYKNISISIQRDQIAGILLNRIKCKEEDLFEIYSHLIQK